MKYILALDQGTTSSRALLIDKKGQIISSAQEEFAQIFPKPGLVEHDPELLFTSQKKSIEKALKSASLSFEQIEAIGITNQRETTILWDKKSGKPLYNAIVWQDRRTAPLCKSFREEGLEPWIEHKTGLRFDPYFSATKILWMLETFPESRKLAEKGELLFGTVDTWLIWKLTKGSVHVTDVSNASRTLLFNIHTLDWDQEILDRFQIPRKMLPKVLSSSGRFGRASLFDSSPPICAAVGDQQSALFAQGCHEKGSAKITYGTGCFLLLNTKDEIVSSKNHLLSTVAWKMKNEICYALEGSVFNAGTVVAWLQSIMGISRSSEITDLALQVTSSEGVYFVPAFTGLGAPHWDPSIRGMMLGLTRGTTKAHIARAALEGIALQVMDVIHAMRRDFGSDIAEIKIDGGLSASDFLMQFQSDILNRDMLRPKIRETTALGAAYLAGLETGYWSSKEEIRSLWELEHRFSAKMQEEKRSKHRENWKKALACAKKGEEIH